MGIGQAQVVWWGSWVGCGWVLTHARRGAWVTRPPLGRGERTGVGRATVDARGLCLRLGDVMGLKYILR
jgi:hypothetical protein